MTKWLSNLFTVLAILSSALSEAQVESVTETKTIKSIKSQKTKIKKLVQATSETTRKTWDKTITAEYSPETEKHKDSNIYYYIDINYLPTYTHRFRYFQRISHILTPEPEANNSGEVTVLNPRLNYYYNFEEPENKSFHLALRAGAELGTSPAAKEDGINAIAMFRLEFDKRLGPVTISLRPYASYWSTQYAVDHLNQPLPLFSVGHSLYVFTKLSPKWSWTLEVDTAIRMLQPKEVQTVAAVAENPTLETNETTKTVLYFGTDIGYLISKQFQVRAGYYQFDKFVADGKYHLELFNVDTTRYFLGIDYFF